MNKQLTVDILEQTLDEAREHEGDVPKEMRPIFLVGQASAICSLIAAVDNERLIKETKRVADAINRLADLIDKHFNLD